MTDTARKPARAAPETARKTVAIEPDLIKDITRNVRKKIKAVPKSPIMAHAITQTAEKPIN